MRNLFVSALLAVLWAAPAPAQQTKRPRLIGISQIVVRAHDLNAARHFYGDLLGFEEAITVSKEGTAALKSGQAPDRVSGVFFKVNNRQYIVVMPESSPAEPRFVRYAVETDDAEAMRLYLKSLGYSVPAKVGTTPTGDLAFQMSDPDGNGIEIMQYTPSSLSVQSVGKYLGVNRLSDRIIHAGFSIAKPESTRFYLEGFSVREFWRADPSMRAPGNTQPPAGQAAAALIASLSNLKLPESDDYIEWSFSRAQPPPAAGRAAGAPARGSGHIALLTSDMTKTFAAIEARAAFKDYTRQHEAHVGINHKWQGNFFDPDGTRTEFMEHDTADGLPSPMSRAPYF